MKEALSGRDPKLPAWATSWERSWPAGPSVSDTEVRREGKSAEKGPTSRFSGSKSSNWQHKEGRQRARGRSTVHKCGDEGWKENGAQWVGELETRQQDGTLRRGWTPQGGPQGQPVHPQEASLPPFFPPCTVYTQLSHTLTLSMTASSKH